MKMVMKNLSHKYNIDRYTRLDKIFGKILANQGKLDKNKNLYHLFLPKF